jgi:hypothetical protein
MKTSASWAVAVLFAAVVGVQGSCLADERGMTARTGSVLGALAGTAVPPVELGRQHARGVQNVNVDTGYAFDGSLSNGAVRGNAVIGSTNTGTITTTNAINNNTGITTVFQNSGNNSLFQQSTSIFITVH